MEDRYCIICGEEISLCMGIVLGRDFVDFIDRKRDNIREICEKDNIKRMGFGIDMDSYLQMYSID